MGFGIENLDRMICRLRVVGYGAMAQRAEGRAHREIIREVREEMTVSCALRIGRMVSGVRVHLCQ